MEATSFYSGVNWVKANASAALSKAGEAAQAAGSTLKAGAAKVGQYALAVFEVVRAYAVRFAVFVADCGVAAKAAFCSLSPAGQAAVVVGGALLLAGAVKLIYDRFSKPAETPAAPAVAQATAPAAPATAPALALNLGAPVADTAAPVQPAESAVAATVEAPAQPV